MNQAIMQGGFEKKFKSSPYIWIKSGFYNQSESGKFSHEVGTKFLRVRGKSTSISSYWIDHEIYESSYFSGGHRIYRSASYCPIKEDEEYDKWLDQQHHYEMAGSADINLNETMTRNDYKKIQAALVFSAVILILKLFF